MPKVFSVCEQLSPAPLPALAPVKGYLRSAGSQRSGVGLTAQETTALCQHPHLLLVPFYSNSQPSEHRPPWQKLRGLPLTAH